MTIIDGLAEDDAVRVFAAGDVICSRASDGTERLYVVDGYTARGKLLLRRENGAPMTTRWRTPADLPGRFHVKARVPARDRTTPPSAT